MGLYQVSFCRDVSFWRLNDIELRNNTTTYFGAFTALRLLNAQGVVSLQGRQTDLVPKPLHLQARTEML